MEDDGRASHASTAPSTTRRLAFDTYTHHCGATVITPFCPNGHGRGARLRQSKAPQKDPMLKEDSFARSASTRPTCSSPRRTTRSSTNSTACSGRYRAQRETISNTTSTSRSEATAPRACFCTNTQSGERRAHEHRLALHDRRLGEPSDCRTLRLRLASRDFCNFARERKLLRWRRMLRMTGKIAERRRISVRAFLEGYAPHHRSTARMSATTPPRPTRG